MERENRDDSRTTGTADDTNTDSGDHLTGGYGGDPAPDQQREDEAASGSSDPRERGSSAPDRAQP